jgi:hypothetical protein
MPCQFRLKIQDEKVSGLRGAGQESFIVEALSYLLLLAPVSKKFGF